jgi:hypothetical protein
MPTADELLDLSGIGQRTEGMRFELRDALGNYLGAVTPKSVVEINNSAAGVLKRTINNFVLPPNIAADVNMISDRVWPYWVLADGTQYQLGVMLFASAASTRRSFGLFTTAKLLDQGLILAQSPPHSIGFGEGTSVTDAIATVFGLAGFHSPEIDDSSAVTGVMGWPAGSSTTFAKILSELCGIAGLSDWYFSNDGTPTVTALPDIATATPTSIYNAGGRIIAGSPVEENDLLSAPNRYIAIDTSATDTPVVGVFDLPDDAPNSIFNRTFPMTKVIEAPGVGTPAAAAAYAETFAQTDPRAIELVSFSSSPDPRHDTFDVVEYLGQNYQELAWSLTGAPGGPHHHKLKRVYQ